MGRGTVAAPMSLPDLALPLLSLPQVLTRLVAIVLVVSLHGWAVAWAANRLGEPGPRYDGRLTLNPLVHLDLVALVHAIFFRVVWMQSFTIDVGALRGGMLGRTALILGPALVLAGASAISLGIGSAAVTTIQGTAGIVAVQVLSTFADIAILSALASLLPVPPFVGGWIWPARVQRRLMTSRTYYVASGIVIVLSLLGVTGRLLGQVAIAWRSWLGY
jgi:hypothetical protein